MQTNQSNQSNQPTNQTNQSNQPIKPTNQTNQSNQPTKPTKPTNQTNQSNSIITEGVKVGVGAYGCIVRPSAKCKESEINSQIIYSKKLSKILKTQSKNIEMEGYEKMETIDKNNDFYLGKPTACTFDPDDEYNKTILNICDKPDNLKKEKNLSLIIMEDGGMNLTQFSEYIDRLNPIETNINEIAEKFWIEAYRIILGINEFIKHGIIHGDLKPLNIVYNLEKNRINFIDFGQMKEKKIILMDVKGKKNDNHFNDIEIHYSHPLETFLYDQKYFSHIYSLSKKNKEQTITKYFFETGLYSFFKYEKLTKTKPERLSKFYDDLYSFIMLNFNIPDENKRIYLNEKEIQQKYITFMEHSLDTFDIYGTGMAFGGVLYSTKSYMDPNLSKELEDLFYLMITPNPYKRIKIDSLLTEYETILVKYNLLNKYSENIFPIQKSPFELKDNIYKILQRKFLQMT